MEEISWFLTESTRLSVTDPWTSLWTLALAIAIGGGSVLALRRPRKPRRFAPRTRATVGQR